MTLPITQAIVSADLPTRSHLPMQPYWITIHETANKNKGADAEMHAKYVTTPEAVNRTVLWHYSVDDDSIVQHLPTNEAGWHAGDGYDGNGNRKSIGIELCINSDGNFMTTQRLAAKLVAMLIMTTPSLKPFPECMAQHNKWSSKDCPHEIRAAGAWDAFIAMCAEEIALLKAQKENAAVFADLDGHWAKDTVLKLTARKLPDGTPFIKGVVKDGKTLFMPDEKMTRAEVAVLIERALTLLGK